MAKFVIENFASSALLQAVGNADTTLLFNSADTGLFPVLADGAKFALVLSEPTGHNYPEIVHVTAIASGVMTVQRAAEGTLAQAWLAGTQLNHTVTAESLTSIVGLVPKGEWDIATSYDSRDLVSHNGVAYIAIVPSLGAQPPNNTFWQVLYNPAGLAGNVLSWAGRWVSDRNYTEGAVVTGQARVWIAVEDNNGVEPVPGNASWTDVAAWSRNGKFERLFNGAGVNNYVAAANAFHMPDALFDGYTVFVRFSAANTTGTPTLALGTFPAIPIKKNFAEAAEAGYLQPNRIYHLYYDADLAVFVIIG